jgi:hypothetical protein
MSKVVINKNVNGSRATIIFQGQLGSINKNWGLTIIHPYTIQISWIDYLYFFFIRMNPVCIVVLLDLGTNLKKDLANESTCKSLDQSYRSKIYYIKNILACWI